MSALTDQDKERARYHLGYMETSFAASLQLGIPRPVQTIFLLEQALGLLVNAYAVARVRKMLGYLDGIEDRMMCALPTLVAAQLGEMKLHPLASQGKLLPDSLEHEYVRWAKRLADVLGVPIYPYSARFQVKGPGSANIRVS